MELKRNIRERRYERMKQIREREFTQPPIQMDQGQGSLYRQVEPDLPVTSPHAQRPDKRLDDPEYVWKQREALGFDPWRGQASDHECTRKSWVTPPSKRTVWYKLWISAALFAGVWGMFQSNHPLAEKGKHVVRAALTEPFDFAVLAAWYDRTFEGAPSFIPSMLLTQEQEVQKASLNVSKRFLAPVRGITVIPFTQGETGIVIEVPSEEAVSAMEQGRITKVIMTAEQGATITVQHAGDYESIYGGLRESAFKENDWVREGERLGILKPEADGKSGKLFFAVKRKGKYVDPADVIHFD